MKKIIIPIIFLSICSISFSQTKFKNLTEEEKKILPRLFKETLKPLSLKRVEMEHIILNEYKNCVYKAITLEQMIVCDQRAIDKRQDMSDEISKQIEEKRKELLNKK